MKGKHIFLSALLSVLLVTLGMLIYHACWTPKTACINAQEVFGEFKLKKQLEADYKKTESKRIELLDSMMVEINLLSRRVEDSRSDRDKQLLAYKKEEYLRAQEEFGQANEQLTRKYDEQIWTQLNQYIKDYGEKFGYDFIYGVTGDGAIMYAKEQNNITAEVIRFVNDRYEGK